MSRATRRDLLGAAGFTALTGIAAATIARPDASVVQVSRGDDAALIALRDRYMALHARVEACNRPGNGVSDDELTEMIHDQSDILDEMNDLTATTLDGHRARAAVLEKWCVRGNDGELDAEMEWRRIGPLFRDLLGMAV